MESYRTDEEQIEELKKWWRENGQATVIGIALALAVVFGWQSWGRYQEGQAEKASVLYQQLLEADRSSEGSSAQMSTAKHLASQLKDEFAGSTYAVFAAMFSAKYAVAEQQLDAAEEELRWVLAQNPDEQIALQAKVRLAHVLLSQKRYEDAQKILSGSEMGSYAALIAETRGDIFLAKGQKAEALTAYREARQQLNLMENAPPNPLLDMKIRDLEPAPSAQQASSEEAEG